jgi:phosphatidylserine decarboxylase
MKHSGKAQQAGLRLIFGALVLLALLFGIGFLGAVVGPFVMALSVGLFGLWFLFTLFTLYFFRDPEPNVPQGAGLVLSAAHGKVDFIDEIEEARFMGGQCRRVSTFLSVFDVHVQRAPVSGRIAFLSYSEGQFLNALKAESATLNENLLFGIETANGLKVGVRLIAGLIARRIVPFVQTSETVPAGERISLIQFGSRVDVYLPLTARVQVRIGDKVVGGETVIARLD